MAKNDNDKLEAAEVDTGAAGQKSEKSSGTGKSAKNKKPPIKERVLKFLRDYRSDIKKIVWPSRDSVIKSTTVVIVAIVAVAIAVGLMDYAFSKGFYGLHALVSPLISGS